MCFISNADFSNVPDITSSLKRSSTDGTLDQVPHREKTDPPFRVRKCLTQQSLWTKRQCCGVNALHFVGKNLPYGISLKKFVCILGALGVLVSWGHPDRSASTAQLLHLQEQCDGGKWQAGGGDLSNSFFCVAWTQFLQRTVKLLQLSNWFSLFCFLFLLVFPRLTDNIAVTIAILCQ